MPLPFVDFWKMRMMSWNQHGRHVTVKLRDDREMEARLWILTATHDVMRDDESMWGCPCLSYIIMVSERSLLLAICMPTAAPHIPIASNCIQLHPIASNCIQLHPIAGWSSFICRLTELNWNGDIEWQLSKGPLALELADGTLVSNIGKWEWHGNLVGKGPSEGLGQSSTNRE